MLFLQIVFFAYWFGPSGATRTRGFHIPNVAPYQLGYTRIFCCHDYSTKIVRLKVFPVCSHLCGQSGFWAGFSARKNPANDRVARGSGLWLFPSWIDGKSLPKQARYQLRYTRLLSCLIRLGVFTQTRRDNSFATPGDLRAASGRTLPAYCTVFSSGAQGGNETFSTRDHPQARDVRSGRDGRILRIAPFCQVSCAENADRGDRPFPQGLAQAASSVSWRQTFTPAMAKAKTNQKMHMTRG